jgi:hypothetical protein
MHASIRREHARICVLFLAAMLVSTLYLPAANAATQAEIVAQAQAAYTSGQNLNGVISQAINSALSSGISLPDIAPALAETLMQAGIQNGADGVALAGQVASAMLYALTAIGTDTATTLRTISEMVEGIRAASDRNGLNADAVRSQIDTVLIAAASSGELGVQLVRVVDAAYAQTHAETYTAPPGPRAQGPPSAPASVGANVANAFNPTASATK